jgi:hypothetical protein
MSWLSRVFAVVMIFFGAGMYILILGGAIAPLWNILAGMPAVTNGPWWELAQTYKFIATNIIPGLLILSGVVVWIASNVREESQRQQRVRRVNP